MVTRIFYLLILFIPFVVRSQDTVFLAKHLFDTPVRNVFIANETVYVKTGDGLYYLRNGKWEKEKLKFRKPYVFYDKGFVEADYLPEQYEFYAPSISYLIPQRSVALASKADLGDRMFVSAGGSLFEYTINKNYWHSYEGISIRDIYIEDSLKLISTYSGIFINDTIRVTDPFYANGYFRKIRGRYFLSSDHLYEFLPPADFRKIPSGVNVFAGYSRKLVEFGRDIYALNTKSLSLVDSVFNLQPVHQGYEYLDLEVYGDRLVFCTQSGEVFVFDGHKVDQVVKLDTRIRDLYQFKNTLYLSSDKGVYTIEGLDSNSLRLFAETPFTVMVMIDALRNTWISTENGLYLLPDGKKELIPYIKDVEFNRGALTFYHDSVFVGSISGLYTIDCYHVVKNFLPGYFNRIQADRTEQLITWGLYFALALTVLVGIAFVYRRYRKQEAEFIIPQKENIPILTPDLVAEAIRTHNITTVEGLAEHYHTNTVQLNRQFKTFDTTPGKFMKKVKLDLAVEMLKQHIPIEEVAAKVGYSAGFIKNEIKKKKIR